MASNYTDTTDTDFKGDSYNIDVGKTLSAAGMRNALHTKENVANKTDTIGSSNSSSSAQYPSVKAVYDVLNGAGNDLVHKSGAETITGVKTFGTASAAADPVLGKAKTAAAANDGTKFATEAQVYAHTASTGNPHGVTKAQVGLGNVDNTSDADKPIPTAVSTAFANLSFFPVGTILTFSTAAWNATASNTAFRTAWKICDGTGGAPDLVGKFLRGSSTSGSTGGANSVTLVKENLPQHGHTITEPNDGKGHRHPTNRQHYSGQGYDCLSGGADTTPHGNNWWYATGYATTDISVNNTFPDQTEYAKAFNIVPEYYTVIYIIKVA